METHILCLANSKKYTQRCVAGIEVKVSPTGIRIIRQREQPKWIRPVSECEHGEIDSELVDHISILDVFKLDITSPCPYKAQSENVYFKEEPFEKKNRITPNPKYLDKLCSRSTQIFNNDLPQVTKKEVDHLDHSLLFICVDDFSFYRTESYKGNPQLRAKFSFHNAPYDLPITDLDFINDIETGNVTEELERPAYLTISLGTLFKGNHYKLVAGVILVE